MIPYGSLAVTVDVGTVVATAAHLALIEGCEAGVFEVKYPWNSDGPGVAQTTRDPADTTERDDVMKVHRQRRGC